MFFQINFWIEWKLNCLKNWNTKYDRHYWTLNINIETAYRKKNSGTAALCQWKATTCDFEHSYKADNILSPQIQLNCANSFQLLANNSTCKYSFILQIQSFKNGWPWFCMTEIQVKKDIVFKTKTKIFLQRSFQILKLTVDSKGGIQSH